MKKKQVTIYLSAELLEKLRNIVYWTPGWTMSGFFEDMTAAVVEKIEKDNEGPYPSRDKK